MQPHQSQIDDLIYRLRRTNQQLSWKEIAQQIKRVHSISYTINDLIYRYQIINAKLTREQVASIFSQFQRCETNFQAIADRTGVALNQVKREVIGGLVNNVWKVCFIVRKRRISSLKSNFISNHKIKELVVKMLRQQTLDSLKMEYDTLWGFISKCYPDSFYQTVSDEHYKSVYRQLIILAEKFRISSREKQEKYDAFQRGIIQSAQSQSDQMPDQMPDQMQEMLELTRNRKKAHKETINLVSSDEDDFTPAEESFQMQEEGGQWQVSLLREAVRLHYELGMIEREVEREPDSVYLQRERVEKAIAIACLELFTQRRQCQ